MSAKVDWKAIDGIGNALVLLGCLSLVVVVGWAPDASVFADDSGSQACDILGDPSDCDNGCTERTVYLCGNSKDYCKDGMQGDTDCTNCACQSVSFECHCTK